ncbi:AI-2E family transporter [Aureimonas altamirensis]|uniref:AI-2E family transporter n=1 Tax=Aureimonas altamirensis TaxID=370622 RepID=UPI002556AF6D|nr:AI-2E family transporter [Aureimonas altamirensis]
MDIISSQQMRRLLPLLTALAVTVLVLSISAILYLGREIFVPFALGILLSFVLAPIVIGLQRLNVPRSLAISAAILTATCAIVALILLIFSQVANLAEDLPGYRATIQQKLDSVAEGEARPSGPYGRALEALQGIASDIEKIGGSGAVEADSPGVARPMPVTIVSPGGGALATAAAVISPLLGPLTTLGIVIVFAIFILLQREDLRNRFIRLAGTDDLQQTTAAIDDAAFRLSRLLLFQFGMNAAFGLITGAGLYLIGVPSPFLWGVLGGILRYIPYVGGFIGAGLPMMLAFAVDPGWNMILWTALLYIAVETAMSNIVEPILYGHSSGLSPVAIILAALIWALLWGPVGLILATPLTICLVVLARYVPALGIIDIMFGDKPALSPPQIFYQRMLAGEPQEAGLQAREFLRERALVTYYDEVALEGIRIAHDDVARLAVQGKRLETLQHATMALVERLDRVESPLPRGGVVRTEAKAAVEAAGPDTAGALVVQRPEDLKPEWRVGRPVICISGNDPLDGTVAAMLAQLLTRHGLTAETAAWADLAKNPPSAADASDVRLVCLSFLEPLSTVHLRMMVRQVHRIAPKAHVFVGIWRQRDPAMVEQLSTRLHTDALVTTFAAALVEAQKLAAK